MVRQPEGRVVLPYKWVKIWKEEKTKRREKETYATRKNQERLYADKTLKQ